MDLPLAKNASLERGLSPRPTTHSLDDGELMLIERHKTESLKVDADTISAVRLLPKAGAHAKFPESRR
jgi:hypothetical protein